MMPVEDHDVHPSTRIGPEHRAGCWVGPGKPSRRKSWYWVKDGITITPLVHTKYDPHLQEGVYRTRQQLDHMSKKCRQIDHDKLPECQGCCAEKDHEYINKMRAMK